MPIVPPPLPLVDSAILLAAVHDLEPPYFLGPAIAATAAATTTQLRIVLVSSLFADDLPSATAVVSNDAPASDPAAARFDALQRLLTFVYVQATRVAQAADNILMDIDVLLRAPAALPTALCTHAAAARIYRVPTADLPADTIPAVLAQRAADTIWLPADPSPAPVPPAHADTLPDPDPAAHPAPDPDFRPAVVALGGTFDHLHAGHKILLTAAALLAHTKLIVGVTADALLTHKAHASALESLPTRTARVRAFLTLVRPGLQYDVVPIHDVYGPTAWDADIQALVVSHETLAGAASIDRLRSEKHLPPLRTYVIDVISPTEARVDASDADALRRTKMSSTFIRAWIERRAAQQPPA